MKNNKMLFGLTKEQLNEYTLPVLLATAICFASFYTFHKASAYVLSVAFLFEAILLFRLFDRLRLKKSGGFIYTLIFTAVFVLSLSLVVFNMTMFGYFAPMRWFYAQDVEEFQPDLLAALFIGGGFFLISVIYYFTRVRYRTMGVMLCTMFPFFFFAKRSDIMPNILITLIMLLFLAVIIHNKRISNFEKKEKPVRLKVDRAYIICISVFILITGAITMAADKPYYQAFLEKNSRLFTPFGIGGGNSSGFEELSDQSSPRNGRPSYTYEPLFYMTTNSSSNELFLRTKAFDVFNGDVWVNNPDNTWSFYSSQRPEYSTDDIINDMSALTEKDLSSLYTVQSGRIFDESFTPVYLPSPYGIITDNEMGNSLRYYKLISDTSVFRTSSYYYVPELNDSFAYYEQQSQLYQFATELNYSSSEYLDHLDSFGENEAAKKLKEDYSKAANAYTDLSGVSQRLSALSNEIVSGCHSDIEKAEKLEKYFSENGFLYSLDYVPEDNSVDYFVFESKTGYCAGYATAMTLMARSVGLPARYIEGFVAFEKNENGEFVIRDGYAHAFVEVYIPGAGWLTFDPTVSGYRENPTDTDVAAGFNVLSRIFNTLNRISVIIVIALVVLVFALLDKIKELFLRISIHFVPVNERIIKLYANLIKTVGASVSEDFSSYTPNMMRDYLSENRGAVPEKLISLFEKTAFGGFDCPKEYYVEAYKEYKKCYKHLCKPSKNKGRTYKNNNPA